MSLKVITEILLIFNINNFRAIDNKLAFTYMKIKDLFDSGDLIYYLKCRSADS